MKRKLDRMEVLLEYLDLVRWKYERYIDLVISLLKNCCILTQTCWDFLTIYFASNNWFACMEWKTSAMLAMKSSHRCTETKTKFIPSPYDPVITITSRKPVSGSKVKATPLDAKSERTISWTDTLQVEMITKWVSTRNSSIYMLHRFSAYLRPWRPCGQTHCELDKRLPCP